MLITHESKTIKLVGLDLKSQIKTNNYADFLFVYVEYWNKHVKITKNDNYSTLFDIILHYSKLFNY